MGVHQQSVQTPLLTQEFREGMPWELLYADDLVLTAESTQELQEKVT